MDLKGKRVAIFVDQQYQEMEVWYPYYRLIEAGASVDFVAAEAPKTYPSKTGYPCTSHKTYEAVRAEAHFIAAEAPKSYPSKTGYPCVSHKSYEAVRAADYDGVIVPGGFAPDFIRRHPASSRLIAEIHAQGKLVAAICHGLWCLCSAGVLRGKRCTSFFAIKDDVVHAGGLWEDSEVVVDGNLVSSRKPDDLPAFMKACMQVLAGR